MMMMMMFGFEKKIGKFNFLLKLKKKNTVRKKERFSYFFIEPQATLNLVYDK
jgi:hypothetical protein